MATNWKTLEGAAKNVFNAVENSLESRSQEKAQVLVDSFNRTRGLWIFLHIPGFLLLVSGVGTIAMSVLKVGFFIAMIPGLIAGVVWWKANFTRSHPFLAFLLTIAPLFMVSGMTIKG